jgi:hypothetical protein
LIRSVPGHFCLKLDDRKLLLTSHAGAGGTALRDLRFCQSSVKLRPIIIDGRAINCC